MSEDRKRRHWLQEDLRAAAEDGDERLLEEALRAGADPEGGVRGRKPVARAAALGREGCLRRLLEAGASVAGREGPEEESALSLACAYGRAGCARILLEFGADPNEADPGEAGMGKRPLTHAAECGEWEAAAALLEAGADPGARDDRGKSALDWARAFGHEAFARALEAWIERARMEGSTPGGDRAGKPRGI